MRDKIVLTSAELRRLLVLNQSEAGVLSQTKRIQELYERPGRWKHYRRASVRE
jgi:hypothetical protein